jgi:hypothetical protein
MKKRHPEMTGGDLQTVATYVSILNELKSGESKEPDNKEA